MQTEQGGGAAGARQLAGAAFEGLHEQGFLVLLQLETAGRNDE